MRAARPRAARSAPLHYGGAVDEPSDRTVRDAIAAYGDPEISRLTAGEHSFVLRPASTGGERFATYHVILVEVPHPMSVMLAATGDEAVITSGRPEIVADVVERDPGLRDAATVWDLIRGGPADGRLEEAELAGPGRYEFTVRDDATGERTRWRLTLSPAGLERVR
jgi:hypothetical protein